MGWREEWENEIQAGFPPIDNVESVDLRHDIQDELIDHLTCAMERELAQTPEVDTARQSVLCQFGNPKTLAFTLWRMGIRRQMMKNRVLIALNAIGLLPITIILVDIFYDNPHWFNPWNHGTWLPGMWRFVLPMVLCALMLFMNFANCIWVELRRRPRFRKEH